MSKKKPLEVVLKTFVEGVGDKGDVVSLKPTFVYNKLLLPGLAVYKTEENIAKYAKKSTEKVELQHSSPYAQRVSSYLCMYICMQVTIAGLMILLIRSIN